MKLPKTFIGLSNFKTFFKEVYNTLSNDKSKLSSKRLITFAANNSVILLTWIYIPYMIIYRELSAVDFIIATGPLVVMGGYSLTKSESAKPTNIPKPIE